MLINDRIVDLELPIEGVYDEIWKQMDDYYGDNSSMVVVYRIRGLGGEATEDVISELPAEEKVVVEPEVEFSVCNVMNDCQGLEVLINIIGRIESLDNTVYLSFAT